MKEPWEWDEADILSLIGVAESATLEFKACDALTNKQGKDWKKEFAKDVSAFANSAGATIIYGLIENRSTHEAEQIDRGFDPREPNIETLEQIVNSRVQRKIEGVRYKAILLAKTHPGKFVYLVHVPESNRAPHMTDHRFYKRYEFQSVEMEEYEVRERYRRETYPGKDVVEAWRDDAINPFIDALQAEQQGLRQETWEWKHHYEWFSGVKTLGEESTFSANAEDFLGSYPQVGELLKEHDSVVTRVNNAGKILFEEISRGDAIREVFAFATSDESLAKLKAENSRTLNGTTATDIFREIFGTSEMRQQRFDYFTEWAINGKPETNVDPMIIFWRTYGERFYSLALTSDYRRSVVAARETLLQVIETLLRELKKIRKYLSVRHNVRVRAPYQVSDYPQTTTGWAGRGY